MAESSSSPPSQSGRQRRYSKAEKANAIAIVQEHGLPEAARRTGIPKGSLSRWARAVGVTFDTEKTEAAVTAHRLAWDKRRGEIRDRLGEEIDALLDRVGKAEDGHAHKLATAVGILIDKAELLAGRATTREEHIRKDRVDAAVLELEEMLDANGNGHH